MELLDEKDFSYYIHTNFKLLHQSADASIPKQYASDCDFCKRGVYLQTSKYWQTAKMDVNDENPLFCMMVLSCPNCQKDKYMQMIVHVIRNIDAARTIKGYSFYEIYSFPAEDNQAETKDIPDEFASLKMTISEALFCLEKSQYISAAIMFRRGLQILAKDVLGAEGRDLFKQLEWLKKNPNKLGINLTTLFHANSDIVRQIGNQGAHPDQDITLHGFTEEDANGLHDLFISLISEVFIFPAKMKTLQNEMKNRRRIKS
jgi:hypothetical protein